MIQVLKQVTSLIIPKFIARKPKIKHGTYNKYALLLHFISTAYVLDVTISSMPVQIISRDYCSKCGQHVNCSDVPWEEEVQLGYVRKEEHCE